MNPPLQIRAITLDVGGTLVEPWPSVGHVYAKSAAAFGVKTDPAELTAAFARAWSGRKSFDYTRIAWRELVNQAFAEAGHGPLPEGCFDAIYARFATAAAWRVYDDVLPLLQELQRLHIPIAFVSNWDERLRPLLTELNLTAYATAIVVSHDTGHQKPAVEIFHRALEMLGRQPAEVLHIGDSRKEDFLGARAAGMQAVWLNRSPNATPGPDEIHCLTDIVRRIHGRNHVPSRAAHGP